MFTTIATNIQSIYDFCYPSASTSKPSYSRPLEELKVLQGDLVYGISKYRRLFINHMRDHLPHNIHLKNLDGLVVNTYLNAFLGTGERHKAKGTLNYRMDRTYGDSVYGAPAHIDWQSVRSFLEDHPKYSPLLRRSPKFASLRLGRACKGFIEKTTQQNNKIIFVLDGIDQKLVMSDKKHRHTERFTTGKEIRFLYRQKNNTALMNNIIFVKDKKIVSAPWIDNPKIWQEYKPKKCHQMDTP